ncbi:MAG: EamA family transporter [Oscillospiraceae bacterium]|jgi:transporter family protein|nr:EamA family transporter [Oscillospiraceae bacterium]
MWLIMAILSAFFAGITAILAKCGIRKTDSDLATALRTIVVLIFSWIAAAAAGSIGSIADTPARSLIFLLLSGLATGASWICYFKALSIGDVNKVVPIDKSSTVLSVLLAIFLFHETERLMVKLVGTALLAVGIFLMIEKKKTSETKNGSWLGYAVLSAVFAALTSILAKIGISGVESNLSTAIRTGVVLAMAWAVVFIKKWAYLQERRRTELDEGQRLKFGDLLTAVGMQLKAVEHRELAFIALSGLATGASWLCYYYAIQNGVVSVVVPIDKLSITVTILFSYIAFGEKLSKKALLGLCLMVAGTLAMAVWA